jgi:Arc/MetJ family transcription regulator
MIPRLFAMFLGGLSAVGASQAPEFAQQYAQRLGGALDELRAVVQAFDRDAAREGLDRQAGLRRLESSPDAFVARRGVSMAETIRRYEWLETQRAALESPNPFGRMAALASGLDGPIARRALESFRPAVPVTSEGFFFALAGFLAGALGGGLIGALIRLPFRRKKAVARS